MFPVANTLQKIWVWLPGQPPQKVLFVNKRGPEVMSRNGSSTGLGKHTTSADINSVDMQVGKQLPRCRGCSGRESVCLARGSPAQPLVSAQCS